jgi:DNA polymerase/3'-5' exonuclease PolX
MSKQTKLFGGTDELKVLATLDLIKATALASQIKERLHAATGARLELVGSMRRQKPKVGDIDFVVVASDNQWSKLINYFSKPNIICAGSLQIQVNCPCEGGLFQVDFYRASNDNLGIQLLIRTGSADHNAWLAGYAISKGLRLKYSQGLVNGDTVLAGNTEESIFAALGFSIPSPQEREVVGGKPKWFKDS